MENLIFFIIGFLLLIGLGWSIYKVGFNLGWNACDDEIYTLMIKAWGKSPKVIKETKDGKN